MFPFIRHSLAYQKGPIAVEFELIERIHESIAPNEAGAVLPVELDYLSRPREIGVCHAGFPKRSIQASIEAVVNRKKVSDGIPASCEPFVELTNEHGRGLHPASRMLSAMAWALWQIAASPVLSRGSTNPPELPTAMTFFTQELR